MKKSEFSITRELAPGMTAIVALTVEEIECAFRAQEYAYRLEDAFEHIKRQIAMMTDDGDDMDAFERRYGFPPEAVEDNEDFADDCVRAFEHECDCDTADEIVWDCVIEDQLKFFGAQMEETV